MVKPLGLPRDSLERRRGGRGGPAPRRDRKDNGERAAKRMNNDYNNQYKNKKGGPQGGRVAKPENKKKGFNPMARLHMGSDAYKGHAKKLKAELIHKAKVKKEFAKVMKQEEQNTPEFYNKIFGERTIDNDGNIVAYKDGSDQEDAGDGDDQNMESEDQGANESDEDMEESGSDDDDGSSEDSDQDPKRKRNTKSKGKKEAESKPGKQADGTFKRAHKPNPFKAAIEKREAEKKAIQEARERAQRERAQAKKGRDEYYANRAKTTKRIREKNSRGQPVLSNQIKMMLGKIKQDVKVNTSRVPVKKGSGHGGRTHATRAAP
ncbi:hypothetical protein B0O80DRAFT_235070 [Mortierella sp. GBAus27b]|nr:hypothetical protein BGX31_000110 [Mortierella sp. GBA43]KAI8359664.1 hypothetical protein B0O80DRAFT_235070 [Mortierella sp. GBAus27b]